MHTEEDSIGSPDYPQYICSSMLVCVCLIEREGERERMRGIEGGREREGIEGEMHNQN